MTMNWQFPQGQFGPWSQGGCQCHQHPCVCGCGPPPECWPPCPPPCPPSSVIAFGLRGPIIGVTDGSFARPGEVGEYLSFKNANLIVTQAQAGVPQFLATLVLPPGDWDCVLTAGAQTIFTGFNVSLDPVPPNIRIPGDQAQLEYDLAPDNINIITGARTFAITNAQPQLITVNYHVQGISAQSFDQNGVTGQVNVVIVVEARRVR